jgi:SPX domain protein involved in polyphosphate accumulation
LFIGVTKIDTGVLGKVHGYRRNLTSQNCSITIQLYWKHEEAVMSVDAHILKSLYFFEAIQGNNALGEKKSIKTPQNPER